MNKPAEQKNGWRRVKLEEVAEINPAGNIPKGAELPKILMDYLVPFTKRISKYEMGKYKGGSKFKNGDTLVARITPCLENGKTGFVDCLNDGETGFGSTEFNVLRERENITNKHFLYYLAISNDFREVAIKSMTGTSGRQRVQTDEIRNYNFLLPPLPEQKAIAEILSSLDDKIDLLRRQNKTLEDAAQALFRQWFVEEADEGWEGKPLGEMVDISSGKGLKKSEYDSNGIYSVLGANGEIGKTNKYLFDEKIIFTGRVGTLGNVFISKNKTWLSDNTLIIRTDKKFFYFVYSLLKNAKLENYNVGSTQPLIRQSDIKEISVFLPDNEIMEKFREVSELLFGKIFSNKSQICILEKLRDTLLPKLMNRTVRVKNFSP